MFKLNKENSIYKNLYLILKPFRRNIFFCSICISIATILSIFMPNINKQLVDEGIMGKDFNKVIFYILIMFGIFIITMILDIIQFRENEYMNNMLSYYLFSDIFRHLMRIKISYFNDNNSVKSLNDIYYDITNISQITEGSVLRAIVQSLKVIGGIIGLSLINLKLTLFIILFVPVKIIVINFLSKMKNKYMKEFLVLNTAFWSWYGDVFGGIYEVKLWGAYQKKRAEFKQLQRNLMKGKMKMAYVNEASQVSNAVVDSVMVDIIYILGAALIIRDSLTLGGLMAFIAYASYVTQPISLILFVKYQITGIKPSLERYIDFFQIEREAGQIGCKNFDIQQLSFKNVSFSYNHKDNILEDISFNIKAGEKVGIVGANGSGKTTMLNLILRFLEPTRGGIKIDDTDITDINLEAYREKFSVINQNIYLFNESIEKNIKMFSEVEKEELLDVCKQLQTLDVINKLPDGFDTKVGHAGSNLSGGERQKVALSRAMIKRADILILDEATAHYDHESELEFNKIIDECHKFKMIICISHSPGILKKLDKIILLDKGKIKDIDHYEKLQDKYHLFNQVLSEAT